MGVFVEGIRKSSKMESRDIIDVWGTRDSQNQVQTLNQFCLLKIIQKIKQNNFIYFFVTTLPLSCLFTLP